MIFRRSYETSSYFGFSAFLTVFFPSVSFALFLGPYSGTVIDSQTGEPIEGASVLFYWEKIVPTPPSGGSSELIETRLVYRDKKGFYDIPRILANLGLYLMEGNIQNVSDIAVKELEGYPDRGVVISELSNYIRSQTGTPTQSLSMLERFKDQRVLPILVDALDKIKEPYYRSACIDAIGELGAKEAAERLLQILVDDKEYPGSRIAAARALGKFGDPRVNDHFLKILKDKRVHIDIRIDAALALGRFRDIRGVENLVNILKDSKEHFLLRGAAAVALGNIGDERAIELLNDAGANDPSGDVKGAAQNALQKMKVAK